MRVCKRFGAILLLFGFATLASQVNRTPFTGCFSNSCCFAPPPTLQRPYTCKNDGAPRLFGLFNQALRDAINLNLNLFSAETFQIVSATFPVYIGARMIDCDLQKHFFSHRTHRNINQLPKWCHTAAQWGVAVPIVLLGSQLIFSCDPEWREAAWFLLLGLPFVIWGKDLIKKFEADCCCRPWHEDFCGKDHKRGMGGFPSGHMAEAMYMTVLYGLRFGPRVAIPLALYATALAVVFINCNRHYASQLVAGAALGALYAVAASKVIDCKLAEGMTVGVKLQKYGGAITCSYRF
jgi:hypothetical protein